MPCYDERTDPNSEYCRLQKAAFEEKYGTTSPTKLRDMLCYCMRILENGADSQWVPEDIRQWYEKHKRWDEDTKKGQDEGAIHP